jgi:DHHC palmitoyltransferase
MNRNETESVPNDTSFDPEAVTDVNNSSSSDIRPSENENSHVGTHITAFEIEMGDGDHNNTTATGIDDDCNKEENNVSNTDISEIPSIMTAPSMDESIDEDIVEMESLLRSNKDKKEKNQSRNNGKSSNVSSNSLDIDSMNDGATSVSESPPNKQKCCSYFCLPCSNGSSSTSTVIATKPYRMGNIQVVYPPIYIRTNGWFVFGPHWFGPPFILFIVLVSSYYIIYVRCYQRHWYLTTIICSLLFCSTVYHLLNTAYRDPGVIIKNSLPINHNDPASIPRSYRYCDTCQYYQPSHAAHCPDCNVCVAGFDHHCVWMSICIGVGNYKV